MIKRCKVLSKNSELMVIDFDGIQVQMKTNNSISEYAYVEYVNGRYSLSTEKKYNSSKRKIKEI